jgi:DNA-binding GntR family transcriptional regulator
MKKVTEKAGLRESKKENLAEEVLKKLQEAIISGELRPNERLVEKQLSQQYGVSRTPVHDAIVRLQLMGQVTLLDDGKAVVTEFSQRHMRDLFEIREALETMVVKLDCERADNEQLKQARRFLDLAAEAAARNDLEAFGKYNTGFHNILLESCENKKLISMVKTVRDQYYLGKLLRVISAEELRRIIRLHYEVIDAILARNEDKAQKSLRKIIRFFSRIAETRL